MNKTFHILNSSHPCTELVLEVNQLRQYLVSSGHIETDDRAQADYILVSTCAFNQEYETEAVGAIRAMTSGKKEGAKVLVTGCLSKINPEVFAELGEVVDLPPRELQRIETVIPSSRGISDFVPNSVTLKEYQSSRTFMAGIKLKRLFERIARVTGRSLPAWLYSVPMEDWFFVRGATGCLGRCSYCAIKRARGTVRSFEVDSIVSQVREAVAKGYRTISFAGDDMGCWGRDKGLELADLLGEVVAVPGDFLVDIRFIEPNWLLKGLPRLEPLFNTGKVASFSAPLQSGSQRILDLMRRDYSIDEAVRAINHVLRKTKVRSISSILMVGFPTETLDDYRRSCELVDRVDVSLWQVLKYEGRPGTPSENIGDKVDERVKEARQRRLSGKVKLTRYVGLNPALSEKYLRVKYGREL